MILGTAMDSLSSMQSFLKGRPKVFKSLEQGIEWWYENICVSIIIIEAHFVSNRSAIKYLNSHVHIHNYISVP